MLLSLIMIGALTAQVPPRENIPGWNTSFAVPSGWRVLRVSGRAVALTDSLETSALFVTVAYAPTAADAQVELNTMFADLHYTPTSTAAPRDTTLGTHPALIAAYTGAGRAGPIDSRAAVVFSRYGTSVTVLGLATPARSAALAAAVLNVAVSVEPGLPATNVAWIAALAGHWDYVPPPSAARDSSPAGKVTVTESLVFDGHERFTRQARTIVEVRGANPMTAESQADSGTYTVVGSTLILRGTAQPYPVDIRLAGDTLDFAGRPFRRKHS
jgi:hypothetical protein